MGLECSRQNWREQLINAASASACEPLNNARCKPISIKPALFFQLPFDAARISALSEGRREKYSIL